MDRDGSSRDAEDSYNRGGDDGMYRPATLTHEQELALQQIIESNQLRHQ